MTQLFKVLLTASKVARVNCTTIGKKKELVEKGDDVATRLMDGTNNGSLIVAREAVERVNHIVRVESVQTTVKQSE